VRADDGEVVRPGPGGAFPGDAKTFVHASSVGIK